MHWGHWYCYLTGSLASLTVLVKKWQWVSPGRIAKEICYTKPSSREDIGVFKDDLEHFIRQYIGTFDDTDANRKDQFRMTLDQLKEYALGPDRSQDDWFYEVCPTILEKVFGAQLRRGSEYHNIFNRADYMKFIAQELQDHLHQKMIVEKCEVTHIKLEDGFGLVVTCKTLPDHPIDEWKGCAVFCETYANLLK